MPGSIAEDSFCVADDVEFSNNCNNITLTMTMASSLRFAGDSNANETLNLGNNDGNCDNNYKLLNWSKWESIMLLQLSVCNCE